MGFIQNSASDLQKPNNGAIIFDQKMCEKTRVDFPASNCSPLKKGIFPKNR